MDHSSNGFPALIDTAGIEAIHRLRERLHKQSGTLMFAGVHDNARNMMERSGLLEIIGEKKHVLVQRPDDRRS